MHTSTRYELENRLINQILPVFALLTTIAMSLVQMRALSVGRGYRDIVQVAVYALLIITTVYRHKLSIRTKINVMVIHAGVIGIMGMLTLGVFAAGVFYLLLTSVVAALFIDRKLILLLLFASIGVLVMEGMGFSMGVLTLDNMPQLLVNPVNWTVYGVGFATLAIFASYSVYMYRQAVNDLVSELQEKQETLSKQHSELQAAYAEIKVFRGIIPICSYCRKIRDDEGAWDVIEKYFADNADVKFTHGVCPSCLEEQAKDI